MGVIQKITIDYVGVARNADQKSFDINASWTVEESAGPSANQYTARILYMEEEVASQTTDCKIMNMTGVVLDPEQLYELEVSSGNQKDQKTLLLHTYENPAADYDGEVLRISWSRPEPDIGISRCLVAVGGTIYSNQIPNGVCGVEIPMSEMVYGKDLQLSITLKPYADLNSSGPPVSLPALRCPSYDVQTQNGAVQIGYSGKMPGAEQLSVTLYDEIYRKDEKGQPLCPAEPLECGPLILGNTAPYTLTVKTGIALTKEIYDSFVAQVWQIVTVPALYALLDVIPRCALHDVNDTLYFHCGLRGGTDTPNQAARRCADVRPGFTLRLEQAQYLPQYQLNSPDAAGFIGAHTADYPITLAKENDGEAYLIFDSFISGMDEEIYSASSEMTCAGAGILDLSAVRMRSPFFRIQYPDAIYSSDVQPDVYKENHALLVSSPGWDNASPETYLLFRGRSALTLMLTVWVNGAEKKLPVGTTWGGLLRSMGIWEGAEHRLKWRRRDIYGRWVSITGSGQVLQNLPLMNGDRVEG